MYNNMNPFPFPNSPSNFPMDMELKNLENRIYNLEKEMNKLQNKITRLENLKKENLYTNNYQPNSYHMM